MTCSKCGRCCKFFQFTIHTKNRLSKDMEDYYKYHDVEVIKLPRRQGYMFRVWKQCNHLTEDNLCAIWETRPEICRDTKSKKNKIVVPEGCTDV